MKLKFALVGCGRVGLRHAEHISNYGILQAVCDVVPERAESIGTKYGANIYQDLDKLLENEKDIDIVSICTPNGLHAGQTIKSFKAGHHVLCEKPMATTVHDAGLMIDAAEKANRRLFIVKQNRFNPPVIAVKKLIENDKLGRIYSVQLNCFWNRGAKYYTESDWKGTKNLDGGTLFTQFSHFIDLLYYLFGDVNEVFSFNNNFAHQKEIEFEDTGVAILNFYNGIIGSIHFTINAYKQNMEGSLTIFAEKGTVKIGGQYLNELEYQNIENEEVIEVSKSNPPNNYGEYVGSMSNHDKVYENVIDVLTNGGIISTNGFEGLKTVEIIDKIYTNARKLKYENKY